MDDLATRAVIAARYEAFRASLDRQNYGDAFNGFAEALNAHPDLAYRYFVTRASGPLGDVLEKTGKTRSVAASLNELITRHPNINLLCGDDPSEVDRALQLRELNIQRGLPSAVIVSQGKSASVAIGNIFSAGFDLPCFAYSLLTLEVIESWARDVARGGASYTTHLRPYKRNISRFKRAGIRKIVVQVRDPRQRLLSMIHHVMRYDDASLHLKHNAFASRDIDEQIEDLMDFYLQSIDWIQGWLEAEKELDILFSTFEEFVRDRAAFVGRYVEFYGGPMEYFHVDRAIDIHEGIDYHYRSGEVDEWRRVFSPEQAARLSSLLPDALKRRFSWPD
jgi:hypothetical protein